MNVLGPLLAGLLSFTLFASPALQASNADEVTHQKLQLKLIAEYHPMENYRLDLIQQLLE